MTKEQIMIDDVDVSECCFYEKHYTEDEDVEIKHFCKIFHYHCETEPNCYYKQLKRKEQECKELNNTITNLENTKEELLTKIDQLKVELKAEKNKLFLPTCYEQLYKETKEMNNDIAKKYFEIEKENKELKEKVNSYNCSTNCYKYQQTEKYKQALQEIKITIKDKNKEGEAFCDDRLYKIEQILQKCEVLDADI